MPEDSFAALLAGRCLVFFPWWKRTKKIKNKKKLGRLFVRASARTSVTLWVIVREVQTPDASNRTGLGGMSVKKSLKSCGKNIIYWREAILRSGLAIWNQHNHNPRLGLQIAFFKNFSSRLGSLEFFFFSSRKRKKPARLEEKKTKQINLRVIKHVNHCLDKDYFSASTTASNSSTSRTLSS